MVGRRRPPTRRERIFGYVGSVIFVVIGFAILLASHALAGLGLWTYVFGFFIFVLISIWGRIAGYLVARATSPVLVARKIPKDERPLWRQRFSAVVEMVVGFSILFVFGLTFIYGIGQLVGGTGPENILAVVVVVAALAAGGAILFWRGWKRWRRISRSNSSGLAKAS